MITKKNSHHIGHFIFFNTSKWHMICWCVMGSSPSGSGFKWLSLICPPRKISGDGDDEGKSQKAADDLNSWQRTSVSYKNSWATTSERPKQTPIQDFILIAAHFCCKIQHFHWVVIRPIIWTKLAKIFYNTFHKFQMKSLFTKWMWFSTDATLSS